MTHYFNLNIKHLHYADKKHVPTQTSGAPAHWLGGSGKAVIFFGTDTVEEIQKSKKPVEAFNFIQQGQCDAEISNCFITTIQNGKVWIYRPEGPVKDEERISFMREKTWSHDIPKSMPIQMLPGFPRNVSEVPLILASMKVNQAFSRNTFREIDRGKYNGNIAAIQFATGHWELGFEVDPLECLSSIELETLVAKLFEAYGCFVPAYKGGFLADVDLFVTPRSRVKLAGLDLDPAKYDINQQTWSIQVKLSAEKDKCLKDWLLCDKHLLITLSLDATECHSSSSCQQFNRDWLRKAVAQTPPVHEWLAESLKWLPKKYQNPPL